MRADALALVTALLLAPAAAHAAPSFKPVDEGPRDPSFAVFRDSLRAALARHDAEAVLAVVDSNIKNGFTGDDGIAAFERQWHPRSMDSPLWRELGATLALGGTFDRDGNFVAPYVYSHWPEVYDAFEYVAITGTRVRVREGPSTDDPVMGHASYEILRLDTDGPNGNVLRVQGWTTVDFGSEYSGYVDSRYVRSPVGYRAFFTRGAAGWRMVLFLAGD